MPTLAINLHYQEQEKSQYHKRKQVSRIIKHLKSRLIETRTSSLLPSDTLIDRWVHIALRHHHLAGNDWQKIIFITLQSINSHAKQLVLEGDENLSTIKINAFLLRLLLLTNSKEMYFR